VSRSAAAVCFAETGDWLPTSTNTGPAAGLMGVLSPRSGAEPILRQSAIMACATLEAPTASSGSLAARHQMIAPIRARCVIEGIEQSRIIALGIVDQRAQLFGSRAELSPVDQADFLDTLRAQMLSQVGLIHRCRRMARHGRVAVDAKDLAARTRTGKEVTEGAVALETGLAADDRREATGHMPF
jgi:hypothetical protein